MNICGIAAEYNPFHKGHEYHIKEARRLSDADGIMVVMSGSFTQRGKPALFDKFTRAKAAISGGADLVVELPFCFACGPAQFFAEGTLSLFEKSGVVRSMCFGSETGSLNEVSKASVASDVDIKPFLEKGMSYPAAYAAASKNIPSTPNDILGMEYVRAIKKLSSAIKPIVIKRKGASYHSDDLTSCFASASAVRKLFEEENLSEISKHLPKDVFELLSAAFSKGDYIVTSSLDSFLIGKIRTTPHLLKDCAYVAEGLENRFYDCAMQTGSIDGLIEKVKTKRYTYLRLSRIAAAFMVGMTESTLSSFILNGPGYIRVLAANSTGKKILSEMKKTSVLPIITNAGDYKTLPDVAARMFELDCTATDLASLTKKNPALRVGRQDFGKLNLFSD